MKKKASTHLQWPVMLEKTLFDDDVLAGTPILLPWIFSHLAGPSILDPTRGFSGVGWLWRLKMAGDDVVLCCGGSPLFTRTRPAMHSSLLTLQAATTCLSLTASCLLHGSLSIIFSTFPLFLHDGRP